MTLARRAQPRSASKARLQVWARAAPRDWRRSDARRFRAALDDLLDFTGANRGDDDLVLAFEHRRQVLFIYGIPGYEVAVVGALGGEDRPALINQREDDRVGESFIFSLHVISHAIISHVRVVSGEHALRPHWLSLGLSPLSVQERGRAVCGAAY